MSTRFSQIITKELDDYADKNKEKIKIMLIILEMINSLSELSNRVDGMDVTADLNSFYTTYCKYISDLSKENNDLLSQIGDITSLVQTYEATLGGSNDVNFKSKVATFCSDLFSNKTIAFNAFPSQNLTDDKTYAKISSSELLNLIQLVDVENENQTEPNPTLPFIFDDIMKKFNDYNQKIISNSKTNLAKVGEETGTTSNKNVEVVSTTDENASETTNVNEEKVVYSKMINNFESLIDVGRTLNDFCDGVKNSYDIIFKKIVTSQKNNNLIGLGIINPETCRMYSNVYLNNQTTYKNAILNAKEQLGSPDTQENEKWTAFINLMLNIANYYINILYMLMYYNVDISCDKLTDSFIDTKMLTSKIYEMYGEQNAIDMRQKFINLLATTSNDFQKTWTDLTKARAELKTAQATIKSLQTKQKVKDIISNNEASTTAVSSVNKASATAVSSVNKASATAVSSVNEASATAVSSVNKASATAVNKASATAVNEASAITIANKPSTTGNKASATIIANKPSTTGNEASTTTIKKRSVVNENQVQGHEENGNQGKSTVKGISDKIDKSVSKGLGQSVSEGLGQSISKGLGQSVSEGLGQSVSEGLGQSISKGLGQSLGKSHGGGSKNMGLVDELRELSRYLRKYQKKSHFTTRIERLDGRVKYIKK